MFCCIQQQIFPLCYFAPEYIFPTKDSGATSADWSRCEEEAAPAGLTLGQSISTSQRPLWPLSDLLQRQTFQQPLCIF